MCLVIFVSKSYLWVFIVFLKKKRTLLFFPFTIWKFLGLIIQWILTGLSNIVFIVHFHQIPPQLLQWRVDHSDLYWLASFQHFICHMDTCSSCTLKLHPSFTLQGRNTSLEAAVSHLFDIPLASLSFSISFYTNFKLMCLNFKQEAAVDWLTLSWVMNKILSQQTPFQEFQQQLQNLQSFSFPCSAVLEEDLLPKEMFHWKFMIIKHKD